MERGEEVRETPPCKETRGRLVPLVAERSPETLETSQRAGTPGHWREGDVGTREEARTLRDGGSLYT